MLILFQGVSEMAHAFKLVHQSISGEYHPDKTLVDLFADHLSLTFCTDIGERGTNAFHFLFASDMEEYFKLCKHYQTREDHETSALSNVEVRILSSYLEKLKEKEKVGEVDDRGADIYVVTARCKGKPFISNPIIRKTREGDISGEKGSTIETWVYELLTTKVLIEKIRDQSSTLHEELQLIRPVLFGFSLDDSGNPLLVEIIPNFGLSRHSILPTALMLNNIELGPFLIDTYNIR